MRHTYASRILAAAVMLATAMPAFAQPITEDNVGEMVHKASTAADLTALADYFRAQPSRKSQAIRRRNIARCSWARRPSRRATYGMRIASD